MPTLTDVITEVNTLTHDLRGRVDDFDKEQKRLGEDLTSKTGVMAAEHKEAINQLNARIDTLIERIDRELRQAAIEAARPPLESGKKQRSDEHGLFMKTLRAKGNLDVLTKDEREKIAYDYMPRERKALYAGDATTGGFFAATDFLNELKEYMLLISNMRKICRVQETSGENIEMPALANDATAYWAAEQANFADSQDPTVAMIKIPVHEIRGLLKVSEQNLEDSMFNLEDLIKKRLMLKFAQVEGKSFILGNGNGQSRGILNYPIKASSSYTGGSAGLNNVTDAIPYVPSGNASNLTPDGIIQTLMDLKEDYEPNSTWILARATLGVIRLFKDSVGRYLWQPFGGSNLPPTIYDRPYQTMPDMPQVAANAYPMCIGDFSNYMIVDRVNMSMARLDELFRVSGLIGFIARRRVGGDVILPESFRLVKVATS